MEEQVFGIKASNPAFWPDSPPLLILPWARWTLLLSFRRYLSRVYWSWASAKNSEKLRGGKTNMGISECWKMWDGSLGCQQWKGLEHRMLSAKGRSILWGVSTTWGCPIQGLEPDLVATMRIQERSHSGSWAKLRVRDGGVTPYKGQCWIFTPRG